MTVLRSPLIESVKSPRFLIVVMGVVVLHGLLGALLLNSSNPSGNEVWQGSKSAFRVRATVLNELEHAPQPVIDALPTEQHDALAKPQKSVKMLDSELSVGERFDIGPLPVLKEELGPALWAPSPADYLAPEQVDAFPRPVDEWVLDWRQVPATQSRWQIALRLWVSASGVIDHVEPLNAQSSGSWVRQFLRSVGATELHPAMLAGQPVPVVYDVQLAPDQLQ